MVNPGFSKFISIKWNDQSLCFLVQWTLSKNAKKDKGSKQLGGSVQWSIHPRPLTAQSQCFLTVWRIANFSCSHWWFLNAHQWTKCWSVNAKASDTKLPTPWFMQSRGLGEYHLTLRVYHQIKHDRTHCNLQQRLLWIQFIMLKVRKQQYVYNS